jgi:hypothetical protein
MMLFSDAVYVGVDPSSGSRPLTYAALGAEMEFLTLEQGSTEHVLAFIAGLETALVAIAGPQKPNTGEMKEPSLRRKLNLDPDGPTWGNWRVAEYELRRRNVRVYNTPAEDSQAPGWVRRSFELNRRLHQIGFQEGLVAGKPNRRMLFEINSHASYTALLEHRPFPKRSLEGRMQRQLVLYLERLDVVNPLYTLEEFTRHRLLTGDLPLHDLHEVEELDALVAALTAYRYAVERERVCQIGSREEGLITLPVSALKDFYP